MDSNILLHFGFSHILLLMRPVRAEASAFCKSLFVESGVSLDTFGTGSQRARISPRSQSLWRILCLKAQLLEEILKKLRYAKMNHLSVWNSFGQHQLTNQIMIYIYIRIRICICILYTQMQFSVCTYINSFFDKIPNVKALKCFVWLPVKS